ncbi:techylectin-5B-like [Bicyclus anynana]|uniref:Techylectin-5B-like n=1 Tax=Bicyclus anynana TaxID=110368 RepID=A0ABM3M6N7_BICAN|nr:techylectin-5B-like [Bicyclus anynana]
MVLSIKHLSIAVVFIIVVSEGKKGRMKQERMENSLWKQEYENELSDAMLSPKRGGNVTRVAQSPSMSDNEAVVEKLIDTISASEKYLKKVESIDFRLNRLDIEIHEKTNSIMKHLSEIIRTIQNQTPSDKLVMLDTMKSDIGQIKYALERTSNKASNGTSTTDNSECNLEATLDTRLSYLENHIKSVLTSVEAITTVISDVKNRDTNKIGQIGNGMEVLTLISEFRRTIQEQKARKCECKIGRVDRSERYPTDCHEIQAQGFNITGIYKIKPDDIEPFYVLCDLNAAGGGWTVIQNRFDGSQDFLKNWVEYKHGFGNLASEFWLGLEKVYYLTNQKLYELRIEMEGQNRQEASASYSVFTIGPEYEGYRISTLGTFRGNAGDSLSYHAGQKFSTYDTDNDEWKEGSCAVEHGGAWWYKECDKSNLNGKYSVDDNNGQSIYWISFKGPNGPLTKTRMMIRPLPASRPLDYKGNPRAENIKRPKSEMQPRKNPKVSYDVGRVRPPYRYDDNVHPDAFFPNYA